MAEDYGIMDSNPTVEESSSRKNRTLVIILLIILVLCCCCIGTLVLGWTFGDMFVDLFSNIMNF
ncbi:MAG: hypothetical protein ACK2TU_10410 [Anaerolineales bacterium]|jgi:hypothetical protein